MPATALASRARNDTPATAINIVPPTTLRSLPQRSVRRLDRVDDDSSTAPRANVTPASTTVVTPKPSSSQAPNVTNTDWLAAAIAIIVTTPSQPANGSTVRSTVERRVMRVASRTGSGSMRPWTITAITATARPATA